MKFFAYKSMFSAICISSSLLLMSFTSSQNMPANFGAATPTTITGRTVSNPDAPKWTRIIGEAGVHILLWVVGQVTESSDISDVPTQTCGIVNPGGSISSISTQDLRMAAL